MHDVIASCFLFLGIITSLVRCRYVRSADQTEKFSPSLMRSAHPGEKFSPSLIDVVHHLEDEPEAPRLICYFNESRNVYYPGKFDWQRWAHTGRISASAINAFAHGEDVRATRGEVVTASDVYKHSGAILAVLDDVASRLQTTWWLYGGALIGAFRYKSLVPWDADLDFCFGDKLDSSKLKQSFDVVDDVDLGGGMRGFLLHSVGKPDHILAYAPGQPEEFYVFDLISGFKAELKYDKWGCDRGLEFVEPVRRVELHAGEKMLRVPIPRDPLKWLKAVNYHRKEISLKNRTMSMPLRLWTRCCKSRQDLEEYANTPSSLHVFVFKFTAHEKKTVKFEKRKRVEIPYDCEELSSKTVAVESIY